MNLQSPTDQSEFIRKLPRYEQLSSFLNISMHLDPTSSSLNNYLTQHINGKSVNPIPNTQSTLTHNSLPISNPNPNPNSNQHPNPNLIANSSPNLNSSLRPNLNPNSSPRNNPNPSPRLNPNPSPRQNPNQSSRQNPYPSQRLSSTANPNRKKIPNIPKPIPEKKQLIDLIRCSICKGYLIDAATIDVCLHSFCRPCIVAKLGERPECPECGKNLPQKAYTSRLKYDVSLQNLVYRLVPGLYEKEMDRRRKYYENKPLEDNKERELNEWFGNIPAAKLIRGDSKIFVGLNYIIGKNALEKRIKTPFIVSVCAFTTIESIKKLILAKFGLKGQLKLLYRKGDKLEEIYFDLTTLSEIAAHYNWNPDNKVLDLLYEFRNEENES